MIHTESAHCFLTLFAKEYNTCIVYKTRDAFLLSLLFCQLKLIHHFLFFMKQSLYLAQKEYNHSKIDILQQGKSKTRHKKKYQFYSLHQPINIYCNAILNCHANCHIYLKYYRIDLICQNRMCASNLILSLQGLLAVWWLYLIHCLPREINKWKERYEF